MNIRAIEFFGFRAWIACTAALLISWSLFAFDAEPQASSGARTAPAKEVFLKAFYALDEPRFHRVDIPGHRSRVNVARALVVHTCKEGIWHRDEIFDQSAISNGQLKMSEYGKSTSYSLTTIGLMENGFDVKGMWKKLKALDPLVGFRTSAKLQMMANCERAIDMWNLSGRMLAETPLASETPDTIDAGRTLNEAAKLFAKYLPMR